MNSELTLNVNGQQDEIQHLKEQFEIDNEDEVKEITAARNPMKKNTPVYVTCNQTFAMKHGLKILFMLSTLSSGKIIMATFLEIERK